MNKAEALSDVALENLDGIAMADGEINPECPNGCIRGRNWCYCRGLRQDAEEYNWGDGNYY
ncbi:hypothetical protein DMA11_23795 [Marinilabiliaceae bacterium JC017]|nr:hypothetical protein DMA11_23795 [Marinilabiliaceae bacterium JC017]